MGNIFLKLLNMSIAASWLIFAVIVLRLLFRKAPKWLHCALWAIVAVRLVCPFSFESMFSLIPSAETISPDVVQYSQTPTINTGISAINHILNPVISSSFAATPGDSINPLYVWTSIAGIVWATGLAVLLAYAIFSYLRIRRMVKEAVPIRDNIYICDSVKSPFILGLIRPRIYLPSAIEEAQMDYVLAHEQAHLRRKDHWWKLFGYMLFMVYWFNPLVWIAYILLCRDIELACDESVIRDLNMDGKKAYSEALMACSMRRRMIMVCPLAFGEVGVKERIKTVLNYKKPAFWVIILSVVVCVVVSICFLTNPKQEKTLAESAGQETVISESTETENGEINTDENGDHWLSDDIFIRELGDLDGDGTGEYVEVNWTNELPDYVSHFTFYWNGNPIYEYDDSCLVDPKSAEYLDMDGDGEREIFFSFYPMVNSMPLTEYIVLKQTGTMWEPLEMIHGETMMDNAFPISIIYGGNLNIIISCEGTDQSVFYNIKNHYEKMMEEYSDINPYFADAAGRILNDKEYSKGDSFGAVCAWGIWDICTGTYADENCLIATHGIQGPEGKFDFLGYLDVYFNYDSNGKVNILNMEFREVL